MHLDNSTVLFIFFLQVFLKRNLKHTLLKFIKDLSVHMPAPSSVELMSHAVISVSFILPLPSSVHPPLVHDLLPFLVERKVLSVVTCFSVVFYFNGLAAKKDDREICNDTEHFSLNQEWQQIVKKKSMHGGRRRENKRDRNDSMRHQFN